MKRKPIGGLPRAARPCRRGAHIAALAAAAVLACAAAPARGEEIAAAATQRIEIIGTTPLAGLGAPLARVPANVQVLRPDDPGVGASLGLAEALARAAGSVSVNDTAGNPYQPDVSFRGFTASPALGTPQGLSVFVDGVRVNEAFGDTVNWDLIPLAAVAKITLVPGSDPVFGRNTLGGALNIQMRTGFDSPGLSGRAQAGSFGRRSVGFELAGHDRSVGGYVTGLSLRDRGWGDHNPSRVQQLFASAGWRNGRSEAALTLTLADNRLEGSQTLPLSFMDDPRQSYTWPDVQTNRLVFATLKLGHRATPTLLLEASAHWRHLQTGVVNSNVDNDYDPALPAGPGNAPTGNAIDRIGQTRPGLTLQASSAAALLGHVNQWTAGVSVDGGRTGFTQSMQDAGASRDTSSTQPPVLATSLRASTTAAGVYLSDNFGLDAVTFVTVSARHERARVRLEDRLGTALNGDHAYRRLNPALGVTRQATPALTLYAGYNEGLRAPTPVELSCADPAAPCSLPNAFAADPALKPVVSRTFEAGARGRWLERYGWRATAFRTTLDDDIQFISSGGGATSAGYFQNVGRTLRQGLELEFDATTERLEFKAHYTLVDARFETPLVIDSPSNSAAAPLSCPNCSDIRVDPGDRIPGLPRHLFKLGAEYEFAAGVSVGVDAVAQGSFYARGDENNRDRHGPLPGYAVFNLAARWRLAPQWELRATVNNLFDRRYSTFGTLGRNVFGGPGRQFDPGAPGSGNEQFRSVGAPRGAWIALTYRYGEAAE